MNLALKTQTYIAKGNAPWFSNDWLCIDKVISMNKLDSGTTVVCDGNVDNMINMFHRCYNLSSIDLSNFDTSNVVCMDGMFYYCDKLTTLDLSTFDTSKVNDMICMFFNCFNLVTIKGVIDMKSCKDTDYYNMFYGCYKLKNVKIKNPPNNFERNSGLSEFQYTIVS